MNYRKLASFSIFAWKVTKWLLTKPYTNVLNRETLLNRTFSRFEQLLYSLRTFTFILKSRTQAYFYFKRNQRHLPWIDSKKSVATADQNVFKLGIFPRVLIECFDHRDLGPRLWQCWYQFLVALFEEHRLVVILVIHQYSNENGVGSVFVSDV